MSGAEIAATIRAQLGGGRFIAMTGAKDFVYGPAYLQFRLPARFARDGINLVKIALNGLDLYDVTFYKLRGVNLRELSTACNVYAEQLRATFEHATGLRTSL